MVLETEHRQAHLKLIADNISLKPLVLQCLKQKESQRPSASQLIEKLSDLKRCTEYTTSIHQVPNTSSIRLQTQITKLNSLINVKDRQLHVKDMQLQDKLHALENKDRELQDNHQQLKVKYEQLKEKEHPIGIRDMALEMNQREMQQTKSQLQASEKLANEFQQSFQEKGMAITNLQQTISDQKKKTQQLEQDTAKQQQLVTVMQTTMKDIGKMRWMEGKNAPEAMFRGAAVVHGNIAYFRPAGSGRIYAYHDIQGEKQWYRVPNNPNENFSLAVIGGLLTSVGGSSIIASLALFSVSKMKVRGSTGLRSFLPCLHLVKMQQVLVLNRF